MINHLWAKNLASSKNDDMWPDARIAIMSCHRSNIICHCHTHCDFENHVWKSWNPILGKGYISAQVSSDRKALHIWVSVSVSFRSRFKKSVVIYFMRANHFLVQTIRWSVWWRVRELIDRFKCKRPGFVSPPYADWLQYRPIKFDIQKRR